jgi:hypothetical protein
VVGSGTLLPRAGAAFGTVRSAARRAEAVHPAAVLAPLVVAHFAVVAVLALSATHNGWLFSTGGAGTNDWTAAWALGHLWVPAAGEYGLPVLQWPLGLGFDGSLPAALPVLVVTQVAIGGALLVLGLYGIGARIGGRLFGYVAALGWVLAPLLSLAFFYSDDREFLGIPYSDYRGLVYDAVLPNALGLTSFPGFVSLVALVGAAWLLVRCLDTGDWNDLILSGLLTGFAVGIEPTNALFVPAPLLALAVARRWRQISGFLVALLPALATLALWRWTGQGHVSFERVPFRWADFETNLTFFRGSGWSLLFVIWLAVAGAFALVRKAPAKGALVAAWFAAFFVLNNGSLVRGAVLDTSMYRLIQPGYPAFVLLAAGVLFLVPGWGRGGSEPRRVERAPRVTPALAAATIALAVYPPAMVALAGPAPRDRVVDARGQSVPVSPELELRVEQRDGGAALRWTRPPVDDVALSYRVYRSAGAGCAYENRGADHCLLRMANVATVRGTSWTDPRPGDFSYRVAAVADGDLFLISPTAE